MGCLYAIIERVSRAEIDNLLLDCCFKRISFNLENWFLVKNWKPPPDSIISNEKVELLYFFFSLIIASKIFSSLYFKLSLSEKALIISLILLV